MTALDALAARNGIEPEFRDATGEIQRVSPEVKHRVLAAMGVEASNEIQAARALEMLEQEEWMRVLPLVCVAYAGRPIAVQLVLPAGSDEFTWRLSLEDGSEKSGDARFGLLTLQARKELSGRWLERRQLLLPDAIPWGYHRLSVEATSSEMALIVTPGRCWLPRAVADGRKLWGIAIQLYLLRSAANWGIGDFGDLRRLVQLATVCGADLVGLNPLHAMFVDEPEHASPYSPASRLLLNVLNIDVAGLPEMANCPEAIQLMASEAFQRRLESCRTAKLVDYAGVAELKMQVLALLFASFRTTGDSPRQAAFNVFRRQGGEVLERTSLFQALRQRFANDEQSLTDWHSWPEEYRDPTSPAVTRFAEEHGETITFWSWLQWLADEQLGAAASVAERMEVGLYRDLAVGANPAGAETWSNPGIVVSRAHAGAPPDIFNPAGQDWGLPPFHPQALREEAYQSFVNLIRANMRHAGGLRVDHAMALQHLYSIPEGMSPSEGAYVSYPFEDLVGILALESQRHRCLVVGEDLGTVPEGFRERMAEAGVLSYRVLFFEQDMDTGKLFRPDEYPELALAVVGSHDLPTFRGWWEGKDIEVKKRLGLFPKPGQAERAREQREQDRRQLLVALREERLLSSGGELAIEELAIAVHAYLARTKSLLAVAQIDDIMDEAEQVNVPCTSIEHPNWRRRLSLSLEELEGYSRLERLSRVFQNVRGFRTRGNHNGQEKTMPKSALNG
jgi:4-alpha-glucanotransferase